MPATSARTGMACVAMAVIDQFDLGGLQYRQQAADFCEAISSVDSHANSSAREGFLERFDRHLRVYSGD